MAKKTARSQHKKQQRALQKRSKRKQKQSRQTTDTPVRESPRQLLRRARSMPIHSAWIGDGWQERPLVEVIVARSQSPTLLLFGGFVVDVLCAGVVSALHITSVTPARFENEILPEMYHGIPPQAISEELAHEIIWGAVEYAASVGLRPHRSFGTAQRVLEPASALPRNSDIAFGYQGMPAYLPRAGDNQIGIVRTLIDTVGRGNFIYISPDGEVPDEIRDLVGIEEDAPQGDAPQPSALWTPDQQRQSSGANTSSGLWAPGDESQSDAPQPSALWTPGSG